MFHVYVLRSDRTGRNYTGSCGDLSLRLDQHNALQGGGKKFHRVSDRLIVVGSGYKIVEKRLDLVGPAAFLWSMLVCAGLGKFIKFTQ